MTFEGAADTSLNLSLHEGVEAFLNKEDDEIPEITEPNTVNIYTETCETSPLSNGKTCMRSATHGCQRAWGSCSTRSTVNWRKRTPDVRKGSDPNGGFPNGAPRVERASIHKYVPSSPINSHGPSVRVSESHGESGYRWSEHLIIKRTMGTSLGLHGW